MERNIERETSKLKSPLRLTDTTSYFGLRTIMEAVISNQPGI